MKSPERFVSMRDGQEYHTVHDTTSVNSTSPLQHPHPFYPIPLSLSNPLPTFFHQSIVRFPLSFPTSSPSHRTPSLPPTYCISRLMHGAATADATSPSSPGTSARTHASIISRHKDIENEYTDAHKKSTANRCRRFLLHFASI